MAKNVSTATGALFAVPRALHESSLRSAGMGAIVEVDPDRSRKFRDLQHDCTRSNHTVVHHIGRSCRGEQFPIVVIIVVESTCACVRRMAKTAETNLEKTKDTTEKIKNQEPRKQKQQPNTKGYSKT